MINSEKTSRHINRVGELMSLAAMELLRRGRIHDQSKFDLEEAGPLAEMDALIARDGNVSFGSPAYEDGKALLGSMLLHHYARNSHHPEHYANGVDGMDLFDIVEMFMDWKAASERGEESTMNLAIACARFKVSDQLGAIFQNTAGRLGWTT